MGMTLTEKILARKTGQSRVRPGDLVTVGVDTVVFVDTMFVPGRWRKIKRLDYPERVIVVLDHRAPVPDRQGAATHQTARAFVAQINTDLILPSGSIYLSPAEQARLIFKANRPGWVDEARPGDIIIAGRNFGMGSSRPASRSLKNLGISCVIAESINGLFFRNCVNYAFPAMECAGVSAGFEEGDVAQVDFIGGTIRNAASNKTLHAKVLPAKLLDLLQAGGIYPLLERQGIIEPQT